MTTAKIIVGDVRRGLATLPDRCVQTVVTSPPYWGLRDYGTASWEGGDPDCDHLGKPMATKANINANCGTGTDVKNATAREPFKSVCGKCGALRVDSQIGLEETPQQFVSAMVEVFDAVWRVLADDGVLWLNLGDSYFSKPKSNYDGKSAGLQSKNYGTGETLLGYQQQSEKFKSLLKAGYKNKDLVGIPWRVAFALQDAGWYLRQDIIWAKPNPMPESVKDRCTKSHEYIFMLTKQARYYFDNDAIREAAKQEWGTRDRTNGKYHNDGSGLQPHTGLTESYETANKRDVWTVATQPFKGAHFAVMPEAIVEPCVRAASRPGDLVLDPFTGSGTVGLVAMREDRRFVGCELNPEYAEIARERIGPLLTEIV